MWPCHQA
ncbi:hypothetical protein D046_7719B, partial [Vibrio parahaemolyticus V-223/04]